MRASLLALLLLSLLTLIACGPAALLTSALVPLDHSTGHAEAEAQQAQATATATSLPLPSPTLTPTPATAEIITPTVILTASANLTGTAPLVQILSPALNIRQGPGVTYPISATAVASDTFEVIGVDGTGYWLQVKMAGGQPGWIAGQPPYAQLVRGDLKDVLVVSGSTLPPVSPAALPVSGPSTGAVTAPVSVLGERLVFMTSSGGDLYVINIEGTGLRKLTTGVIDPVISPDRQQVAFTRWDGAEFGTLYVMNLDGTGERAILGGTRQAKSPTWSPDGQEIILSFQRGGLRDPVVECRRFGSEDDVRVPENAEIVSTKVIGEKDTVEVCFIPKEDLQWGLRRINLVSSKSEDLPTDLYSFNPTWDPQNPWRIIYDGPQGLMQLDVNTGVLQPFTDDLRDTAPVFSPDGQKLALTYKQHDHWEVYTYELATGARQRLTKPPILADPQYNSAAPAWSPHGSQIAFLTDRTGRWEIWVMNVDGSNPRPMFPPEVQAQINLNYAGVNERMLNWVK
jgi:hypothetical protein